MNETLLFFRAFTIRPLFAAAEHYERKRALNNVIGVLGGRRLVRVFHVAIRARARGYRTVTAQGRGRTGETARKDNRAGVTDWSHIPPLSVKVSGT
jgi:hypothetical protein